MDDGEIIFDFAIVIINIRSAKSLSWKLISVNRSRKPLQKQTPYDTILAVGNDKKITIIPKARNKGIYRVKWRKEKWQKKLFWQAHVVLQSVQWAEH
ncbi:MAG: hypothetical protein NC341_05735 [Blautia sp.]|nr:hypothetical protein [Blautia sp.]MCM1200007.1 hypothetical protein [Bacteroides fragilis]